MNLRDLPSGLSASDRCEKRRRLIEHELNVDLGSVRAIQDRIGTAEEKNCEQMFGHVPLPVGLAGPLRVRFSNRKLATVYLPLATTEGALVASVNRGCKVLTQSGGVRIVRAIHHGMTRSIAFRCGKPPSKLVSAVRRTAREWKMLGEMTSNHLKILRYDIAVRSDHLFLTIACDTDEAMGMNMVTIASQAIGDWIAQMIPGLTLITIAGNVDSDKKPSQRTHDLGRGYEVIAEANISDRVIATSLKTTSQALLAVAKAKLTIGSHIAGAIGKNLHAGNVIAATYLATGQDAAHVTEGSLTDTIAAKKGNGIVIRVRVPALLVGVRGGGTALPAQHQCLGILLKPHTKLHPKQQLAESIAAAVLAGELSLLAAQSNQTLASSHRTLAR